MKFKTLRMAAAVATLCACSQAALAEGGPEINFSGFGTLGFVTSDTDTAIFRNGFNQHSGATESDTDMGVDSRLGLQANVKFNDTFSAVGQVLARRTNGEFAANIEWLYGQAKVADWADVRVGRMVLPVFMVSDSRNVGYAMHWLRAPQEAYGFYPSTYFDGVQGVFRHNMADTNFTLQVSAGTAGSDSFMSSGTPAPLPGGAEYNKLYSVSLAAERGNWLGRIGYTVGDDSDFFLPAASLNTNGKDKFMGLGLQYDNGTLLVMSEYVTRRWTADASQGTNKAFDSDGYYVSAGYRFGAFMPYISTSTFKPKGTFFTGPWYTQNGKTNAVGVRWDFMKNVALKAQVEETKGAPGAQVIVVDPSFNPNEKIRAISAAVDFVF